MPSTQPSAWVLPRGGRSVVVRRDGVDGYRGGPPRLRDVAEVPMPARAPYVLDLAADVLVFAHRGELTIVRGIAGGPRAQQVVEVPTRPKIHALTMIDGVVFVGADAGKGMLGWCDLRGEPRWRGIDVPAEAQRWGKAVDGFAVHGTQLIVVDDKEFPRYFFRLDVSRPRAPRMIEIREMSHLGHVASVDSGDGVIALLMHGFNHGAKWGSLELIGLSELETRASLAVPRAPSRNGERCFDLRALAMARDRVFIAAGADGIGVMNVPARASEPRSLSIDEVRFVPVRGGVVVDVVAVDADHVLAIVEQARGGLVHRWKGPVLHSLLVAVNAARRPDASEWHEAATVSKDMSERRGRWRLGEVGGW